LHSRHRQSHRESDCRGDRAIAAAGPVALVEGPATRRHLRVEPSTLVESGMPFTLPPLPYPANALEPHIDARTMEIHHGKHHQAYVTNLNGAIEKAPELAGKSLEQLLSGLNSVPEAVRTAVRNNGGGHWNHSMFWEIMGPNAGGAPGGKLADAI